MNLKKKFRVAKVSLKVFLSNILSPTSSFVTDVYLAILTEKSGREFHAFVLLLPLIVNTFVQFSTFAKFEETRMKKFTWPLVILQLWQQYHAVKIIVAIWKDYDQGKQAAKNFDDASSSLDTFFKSLPLIFIKLWLVPFIRWGKYDVNLTAY